MSSVKELIEIYRDAKKEKIREQLADMANPLTEEESTTFIKIIADQGVFSIRVEDDKKYREFAKWFNQHHILERTGLLFEVLKTKGIVGEYSNFRLKG
jgi:hypothetical protein